MGTPVAIPSPARQPVSSGKAAGKAGAFVPGSLGPAAAPTPGVGDAAASPGSGVCPTRRSSAQPAQLVPGPTVIIYQQCILLPASCLPAALREGEPGPPGAFRRDTVSHCPPLRCWAEPITCPSQGSRTLQLPEVHVAAELSGGQEAALCLSASHPPCWALGSVSKHFTAQIA